MFDFSRLSEVDLQFGFYCSPVFPVHTVQTHFPSDR